MKADAKRQYIDALVELAQRKTKCATEAVVVQAYRFFDEACSRNGLPHPFTPGNVKQILDQFTEGFHSRCFSDDGDEFPINVMKVARNVVTLCGHSKQAFFDEEKTPERYAEAATVNGRNGLECWALFGPNANRHHPMIKASFTTEKKRIETTANRFDKKTEWVGDESIKLNSNTQKLLN